jgi:hypothetical protein
MYFYKEPHSTVLTPTVIFILTIIYEILYFVKLCKKLTNK